MNNIQILAQKEVLGKSFTIYGDFENPLFLAKDVANWIEHSNSTMMLESIDEDEKVVIQLPTNYSLVGLQSNTKYTFLTEDGFTEGVDFCSILSESISLSQNGRQTRWGRYYRGHKQRVSLVMTPF